MLEATYFDKVSMAMAMSRRYKEVSYIMMESGYVMKFDDDLGKRLDFRELVFGLEPKLRRLLERNVVRKTWFQVWKISIE